MSRQDAVRIGLRPVLAVVLTVIGMAEVASAQVPGTDVQPGPTAAAVPTAVPPTVGAAGGTTREAELEARVRQLEAMVSRLAVQINQGTAPGPTGAVSNLPTASNPTPSRSGGPLAPGQSMPPNPPPSPRFELPAVLDDKPLTARFGPGFELKSADDEYVLQFHNLSQFDFRGYQQGGQNPVHDTFAVPRQWYMWSGQMTKQWQYFVSMQNGFDTVSLLDAWIDWNYDPKFKIRAGRFKTPFTYEFYVEPIQGLFIVERSIFFNNFAINRSEGIMANGRLCNGKFDYAVGGFNGIRNLFLDNSDGKAIVGLINYKPWGDEENTLLENFNIGGSVYAANQSNNIPIPTTFRTVVPTAGNSIVGVPFMTFNSNVRDSGDRAMWDLHLAWFYKQLSVISEWGSGFEDYSLSSSYNAKTHLPIQSYYVQGGYWLTGETNSGTGIVKPLQPFSLKHGQMGPGAWQLVGRYEYLNIGREVFTNGLADANNWTNQVQMVHAGANWSPSQYIKIMFDWTHADFGSPVLFAPNKRQLTSDMFTVRFQLFF
jgi:phosphate-selective porin OprO and OprP